MWVGQSAETCRRWEPILGLLKRQRRPLGLADQVMVPCLPAFD